MFRGEGILAVTKALLESGVAYVAGYQGAPISHLMDVLADAQDILAEHGIRFENSASEATAAATLAASVNYPLRGAVTFKSTVGTNVASDALANLASGGVTGGALIIVGEDYGEGSSIMQERSHAFAMKSQIWLLDPRPNLPSIVAAVKQGFELSEASHTPVMLQLRIRACHVHGRVRRRRQPAARRSRCKEALENPRRDVEPHRAAAGELRARAGEGAASAGPRRCASSRSTGSTSSSPKAPTTSASSCRAAATTRCCARSSAWAWPTSTATRRVPLYVMNVAYPVIDSEVLRFCEGKRAVLMVEEGQPNFIEQNIATHPAPGRLDHRAARQGHAAGGRRVHRGRAAEGRARLPRALRPAAARRAAGARARRRKVDSARRPLAPTTRARAPAGLLHRLPRAADLHRDEAGGARARRRTTSAPTSAATCSRSCRRSTSATPRWATASALPAPRRSTLPAGKRAISVMGDGGFWHNGLTSGIANAVFNRSDNLTIVVDNNYTSATGGQDILSSTAHNPTRSTGHAIERAVRGVGVKWVQHACAAPTTSPACATRCKEALTTKEKGPKVLIAQSECMLNKQRREKPLVRKAVADGKRVVRERFGVDADTCTGDHSCIRLSGCPSLSIKPNPDPLRTDPVATVLD